jgi:hypothetical protein
MATSIVFSLDKMSSLIDVTAKILNLYGAQRLAFRSREHPERAVLGGVSVQPKDAPDHFARSEKSRFH